jgi:hypothetical protein
MFKLQNRYQDSDWGDLGHAKFHQQDLASRHAQNLSENTISYGMVRVIDIDTSKIIATFTGGVEITANRSKSK